MKDNQRIASRALSGRSLLLSLFQLMAVMTSLGAALTVLQTLFLPPLGRSGLEECCLPALVLVIALWFCCRGTVARLGSYAVVASLLALSFYAQYFSRHDPLFGHTPGPPQLFVATGIASTIGILAGIGWFVSKRRWAKQIVTAPAVSQSRGWRAAHWLVDSAIVVLTLLSALLAVLTIPNLITDPLIGKNSTTTQSSDCDSDVTLSANWLNRSATRDRQSGHKWRSLWQIGKFNQVTKPLSLF
jgi:hypothetical protein